MIVIRLSYIVFLLFSAIHSFAQQINVNVVVIHPTGKKFTLYVNNEKVNNEPQAIVKAYNVNEGWCRLKAEVEETHQVVTDSFLIKPIEKNNNKEMTLSFSDHVKNGKPYTHFDFIHLGEPSGPKQPIVPELPDYLSKLTEKAVFGNIYQITNNKPDFFKNYDSVTSTCKINIDEKDIEHFKFLLSKSNDFSNRALYTRKMILNNCYSADQLIKILNTMEIEMEKLKLSKQAYFHLLDKQNAHMITAVFKFKTMSEEYLSFLKDLKNLDYQKSLQCKEPVAETEFKQIYMLIVKEKYEHDKILQAKKQVVNHCFTSEQAKKMIDIFTHDREKMELAKAAYPVIVDKENYKIVENCFSFSENKKEFINFLNRN